MKVHWFRRAGPNFGDGLTHLLLDQLGIDCEWAPAGDAELFGVGSILDSVPPGFNGIVWTTGKLSDTGRPDLSSADVLALRGRLTLERVGCSDPQQVVLGDAGLLCHQFARPAQRGFKIGIIPHYVDADDAIVSAISEHSSEIVLIDIRRPPLEVIHSVAECEYILSSSLHGLVLADSLRIPNQWIKLDRGRRPVAGEGFKFRDYYSVFDLEVEPLELNPGDTLETLLPAFDGYERPSIDEVVRRVELSMDALTDRAGKAPALVARRASTSGRTSDEPVGRVVPPDELKSAIFGQQHIGTQSFFESRFGQFHTIPLEQMPHYRFLVESLDRPFDDNVYLEYLRCSWDFHQPDTNTPERRRRRVEQYLDLYGAIKRRQQLGADAIANPIILCRRPDGRDIIVDGNHRASVALALGLDSRVEYRSAVDHLQRIISVPDQFYGTKHLGRPYQSVFDGDQELIEGRRRDVWERMQRIPAEDLEGRTVLDLGCNLGLNCYLAAQRGASRVVGVEYRPEIASAGVRLNAYFAQPCRFMVHDLTTELPSTERLDTVFCFSLVAHLKSTEGIVATIKKATGRVLYFEGHAGASLPDYAYLLNKNNFRSVELLGFGHDGIHTNKKTRPFFRCETYD